MRLTERQSDLIWWAIYLDTRDCSPLEIARSIVPDVTEQEVASILKGFSGITSADDRSRAQANDKRHVKRKTIEDENICP